MLSYSTATFSATMIATAIAAATSGDSSRQNLFDSDVMYENYQPIKFNITVEATGAPIMFYKGASELVERAENHDRAVDIKSIKMQLRYQSLERSFSKHNQGFPESMSSHFTRLSNALCRLPFTDNVSYYNNDDESIETILKLSDGLTLSLSHFLDSEESSTVFSLHRDSFLLVADELPINEIVETILSVIERHELNGKA